jgi:hypothetical protein
MKYGRRRITAQHLVSLNTARIKLRSNHPRISKELEDLFEILKVQLADQQAADHELYKDDGLIDIE